MQVSYFLEITDPHTHIVKVTQKIPLNSLQKFKVFLPSWSPGSYLMREYSRHIRNFYVKARNGEFCYFEQIAKGTYLIDLEKSQLNQAKIDEVTITYEVYCHELTVRTSHVDARHAFLHLPTLLMGICDRQMSNPTLSVKFPTAWSKISTGLKDISKDRSFFEYTAKNYDELIDSPIEIGCHETDGFLINNIPHELAFFGTQYTHQNKISEDIKKIVESISKYMGGMPYEKYTFITHFVPKLYGGLEHLNSTALQFDGRKLGNRKDYLTWLSLVAHEYFHLWNVKRIRPIELGPFDYQNEGYTKMLWLAEGLTDFMDDLFVYRAGLSTLEEYLESVKNKLETYYSTPGKKFHSLEDSSFNAWIKLYRPDENSKNSSISYYLKGALVFSALHAMLALENKSVDQLVKKLWDHYQNNPMKGVTTEEVLQMITEISDQKTSDLFYDFISTTKDIDFETLYKNIGLALKFEESKTPYLGADFESKGDALFIKSVTLDSPGFKCGLNAGDEIIAIDGLRFLKEDESSFAKIFKANTRYKYLVSRLGQLLELDIFLEDAPKVLKEIQIVDRKKVESAFR